MEPDQSILIGTRKRLRFYPRCGCLCPSDRWFLVVTMSFILVPTLLLLIKVIIANPYFETWLKILLACLDGMTLFMCVYSLFKCSFKDPGIIPSLFRAGLIPASEANTMN